MKKIIIAIDGHSSCGKSSTAKIVAAEIGYNYIDTGAMYRAVTLYFLEQGVDYGAEAEVDAALNAISIRFEMVEGENHVFLNGVDVEEKIRTMEVSSRVSPIAAIPAVRHKLTQEQQEMGQSKGIVMDGRDIGTNVFPNAELKVFMTADVKIRGERRLKELQAKGEHADLGQVIKNLRERDEIDSNRSESPLKKAEDAFLLDTSDHSLESQAKEIIGRYRKLI